MKETRMSADDRLRCALEIYYDLIVELEPGSNVPIYNQEKLSRFFSTDRVFTDYDELFWHMANEYVHPDDLEAIDVFREEDLARREKEGNSYIETEFRIRRDSGYIWVQMVVVMMFDEQGKVGSLITLFKNINTKKCIELENTVLAHIDSMTGLYNKKYAQAAVEERLSNGSEYGHAALVMIDIDNFKRINDTYGHLIGDRVIIEFSKRIMKNATGNDVAGRYGGDEFVLFIAHVKTEKELERRVKKLCAALAFEKKYDDVQIAVHCSMGVAVYSRENYDFTKLFQAVDRAMYRAKAKGKGTYEFEHTL